MQSEPTPISETEVLLHVAGLSKIYRQGGWLSRNRRQVQALKAVNLEVRKGSTLALVGASGSGKSTLARCIACLEQPDSGKIWFADTDLAKLHPRELIPFRRQIQMVFQEPGMSLNPRLTAIELVSEPLLIAGQGKKQRHQRAMELMALVGLPARSAHQLLFEFSGGQRRRLAIARALTLEPKLLILDESLAGLDLSIQAQIFNLLLELQAVFSLTCICISHDLDLMTHLADEIAILSEGRIVERIPASELLVNPTGGHARRLLEDSITLHSSRTGAQ